MPRPLLTDEINGPHFLLEAVGEDWNPTPPHLRVRSFYAGAGKVHLTIKDGRKAQEIIVDAADLIDAIRRLVPAAVE